MRPIKWDRQALDDIGTQSEVVAHLGKIAQAVTRDASPPHWLDGQMATRVGVSDRGAFAQAICRGSGAIKAEFDQQPFLRPALDRQRGR